MSFSSFDKRGYRTLDVRSGYREWLPTYEQTVEDAMDIALLEELRTPSWAVIRTAADLGCGTGRTGTWLRAHGVDNLDGVDLTPEMLAIARQRGVYRHLVEADVASTGLDAATYDLVISCLVDEHLPDLRPLYREASRLANEGALFVLVGFHPHFIMAFGIPTHFDSATGEPLAIETHVHLTSDHVTAATETGWELAEMKERVIDNDWLTVKPRWQRYEGHPISFAFVWRKVSG